MVDVMRQFALQGLRRDRGNIQAVPAARGPGSFVRQIPYIARHLQGNDPDTLPHWCAPVLALSGARPAVAMSHCTVDEWSLWVGGGGEGAVRNGNEKENEDVRCSGRETKGSMSFEENWMKLGFHPSPNPGGKDRRVPPTQGLQMYNALKAHGVDTKVWEFGYFYPADPTLCPYKMYREGFQTFASSLTNRGHHCIPRSCTGTRTIVTPLTRHAPPPTHG